MSDKRASPLAAAFLWAVGMMLGGVLVDAIVSHEPVQQVASHVGLAAGVAGVVAYRERKEALKP